jgi:putative PIN family toxin of toxin-antitoxin system
VRIVLDTNVLVSALLSPHGAPARILDLVLAGSVTVLFDDRIFAEYEEILARPKLQIPASESTYILDFLVSEGTLVSPSPLALELPDLDDLPFVEVASAADADALVTGNTRHFAPAAEALEIPILSPAEFLATWHERG